METLKDCKLDCDFMWTEDDADLPDKADCGMIETCAGTMNPGQLVLAMAEQITALGGQIVTSCKVYKIQQQQDKLQVKVNYNKKSYTQTAKNVVHGWNGYGNKDMFLPKRLASQVHPFRCQVVGLKNPGISISKSMSYFKCKRSEEEFLLQRKDGTFLFGGFDWLRHDCDYKEKKQAEDKYTDDEVTVGLAAELGNLFPSRAEKTEITHAWSGLLCCIDDEKPLVGAIKELPGQYTHSFQQRMQS